MLEPKSQPKTYTYDISWNYGWKLCEKKEVMLDEKMGKVAKGEKEQKNKKRKEKKKNKKRRKRKEKNRNEFGIESS